MHLHFSSTQDAQSLQNLPSRHLPVDGQQLPSLHTPVWQPEDGLQSDGQVVCDSEPLQTPSPQ